MERRVTAVELRPINLLTASQIAAATGGEDEVLDEGPNSVVGPNAPNRYKPIQEGYFYSKRVTGGGSGVEFYFESDLGISKDETLRVSGVNKLQNGSNIVDFDLSKDFKVVATDTPPWEGRNQFNGQRDNPVEGDGISNTVFFTISSGTEYSTRRSLLVKRRISTVEATITTAKIVFTGSTIFKAGDVVYVDLPETDFFGLDGLFRVKESTGNYITYDFDAPLAEPINVTNITNETYVHAVAQSAIRNGATWIDTAAEPDLLYVWEDIRWVLLSAAGGDVEDDNINPSPVTNLQATHKNDTPPGAASGTAEITLTWNAPTTNEDGTPLRDLAFYEVEQRYSTNDEWAPAPPGLIVASRTSWINKGYPQDNTYYFRVRARDSGGNVSLWSEVSELVGTFEPEVAKPKAPAVTTYLGTIKISYDDLTANNTIQAATAKEIEVFKSDVSGFTPGPDTFYGTFPANAGSYIIIPGTELVDNTDYYIKIRVRDIFGNFTEPSNEVTIRAQLKNIVKFDMIDVGTLTAQVIVGLQLATNTNPSVNGGIIINQQGITAYAPPSGAPGSTATQKFRIDAATGSVVIGDYLGRSDIEQLYLSKLEASSTYATSVRAEGIAIVAGDAKDVAAAVRGDFDSLKNNFDALTQIGPGIIRVFKPSEIIGAVNKGSGSANVNNTTTIEGGVIRAGSLDVNRLTVTPLTRDNVVSTINGLPNTTTIDGGKITTNSITANQISTNYVYAGTINADNITSGTLVGRTIRTAAVGSTAKRIILNTQGEIVFFNAGSSTEAGRVEATAAGLSINGFAGGNLAVAGSPILGWSADDVTIQKNTQVVGRVRASGQVQSNNGACILGANITTTGTISADSTLTIGGTGAIEGTLTVGTSTSGGIRMLNLSGATATTGANINTNGFIVRASSSRRYKQDISNLQVDYEDILNLQPKIFRRIEEVEENENAKFYPGFIAEDLAGTSLDPFVAYTNDEEGNLVPEGIHYPELSAALAVAIKEQDNKLNALEARLAALEAKE